MTKTLEPKDDKKGEFVFLDVIDSAMNVSKACVPRDNEMSLIDQAHLCFDNIEKSYKKDSQYKLISIACVYKERLEYQYIDGYRFARLPDRLETNVKTH